MSTLDTARSKQIDAYIQANPLEQIADKTDEKCYAHIKGKLRYLNVYRLPIDYLLYNIRNGRFRAELISKETELKRKLNPIDKQDIKIIQNLLLEQNESETIALKNDIAKDGQLVPGIITFDGAVINANRRMSIISKLYEETSDKKYKYLIVGRLPKGVDESDLWDIEGELQFGRDFRLEYGGVNELLKLEEGKKLGKSEKAISIALKGRYTEAQVKTKLEILKLVKNYLAFVNRPNDYNSIQESGSLEKFISLHTALTQLKKAKKQKEEAELTIYAFSSIANSSIRHLDIRKLKDISDNTEAYKALLSKFDFKSPLDNSKSFLEESFATATDIVESQKATDRPAKLLTKALNAITSIDKNSPKLKDGDVKELLQQISKRIADLQLSSKK